MYYTRIHMHTRAHTHSFRTSSVAALSGHVRDPTSIGVLWTGISACVPLAVARSSSRASSRPF
jgi:hypothetical protein